MKGLKIYFKDNFVSIIAIVVTSIFISITSYKLSEKLKIIFNEAILKNNLSVFEKNILIIFLISVILFLLNVLSSVLRNLIYWRGAKNIKLFSINKMFKTDYKYFIENNPISVWTDLNISSGQVSDYYTAIFLMFSKVIEFAMYLYIVFNINVYAGVFSLSSIPIMYLTTYGVKKKMSDYRGKMIEKSKELSAISVESLNSINNIKVKNEYNYFLKKIEDKHIELNRVVVISSFYENYWNYIVGLINSIVPIVVLYLIMKLTKVISGNLGEIIILFTFIPLLLSSFKEIYSLLMQYHISKPYLNSIKKMVDLSDENTGEIEIKDFNSLETNELTVIYNNNQIVKIPDMKINKGEKVLIIGESGIGKSTFFNILLGLNKDYTGNINVNGVSLNDININTLRNIIGISFQNNGVFTLTLKENIVLGNSENSNFNKILKITELEKQLADKKNADLNMNNLSGGEKSRISIAQNLIRNPQVILIDESFSSVDEEMESNIVENLMKEFSDKTIVCISHRESTKQHFNKIIYF